jgi:hypothetical protein
MRYYFCYGYGKIDGKSTVMYSDFIWYKWNSRTDHETVRAKFQTKVFNTIDDFVPSSYTGRISLRLKKIKVILPNIETKS